MHRIIENIEAFYDTITEQKTLERKSDNSFGVQGKLA